MATMYETIMDLPLFKGVSKEQVSLFLEKTNIGFRNYEPHEQILRAGDEVRMVKFVISGVVKVIHPVGEYLLSVEEECGCGSALGAERLFGISTGYSYDVRSMGKVSILEFSKEQYINLLLSDRIYLFNFLNYVSLRAQRPVESLMEYASGDIRSRFSILISVLTHPSSKNISIMADDGALARYCSVSEDELREWKREMHASGLIEYEAGAVRILSRQQFL